MQQDYDTLEGKIAGLCAFFQSLTGFPAFKGKTPFTPQSTRRFIVLWLNSFQPLPSDTSEHKVDEAGNYVQELRGLALAEFEVQAYGPGAIEALTRCRAAIGTDIWYELMSPYKMGTSERGEVQNASAPLADAAYEERAAFTCSFYVCVPQTYTVGYFDRELVTVADTSMSYESSNEISAPEQVQVKEISKD